VARDTSAYVVDGVRLPSVTEILSINGLSDFSKVPADVLETARARGVRVHEWLEWLDKGELADGEEPDEEIAGYIAAYSRFREASGFDTEWVEHVVINRAHSYVGTLDRAGKMNGDRVVIDLKTVSQVSKVTALQTAGYAACFDQPHKRYALQLKPTGKYTLHPYTDRNDKHDFLAAVRLTHWRLRNGEIEL